MKFTAVEGNRQRLDGGAMFGNAPKAVWERWMPADERNRIPLACRSLLIQTDDEQNILVDAGIGAFFDPKLKDRYGVEETEHVLLTNLKQLQINPEDIDSIILSHLHFDHAGGLLTSFDGKEPQLAFPNAQIFVGAEHWEHAQNPPRRERASFLPQLHTLLEQSGRLQIVNDRRHSMLPDKITFSRVNGHSVGVLLPKIKHEDSYVLFVSDLAPGLPWLHLPITMGYDRFPELLIEEKARILEEARIDDALLFFTHDPNTAWAQVEKDEKDRYCGTTATLIAHH